MNEKAIGSTHGGMVLDLGSECLGHIMTGKNDLCPSIAHGLAPRVSPVGLYSKACLPENGAALFTLEPCLKVSVLYLKPADKLRL